MSNVLADFESFMKQREMAARAYVNGDATPVSALATHALPATFFAPKGGHRNGAKEVASTYANDAKSFEPGKGTSRFEILQMAASGDIGYWVGFQRATSGIRGREEPVMFDLRVTEIFRREGNQWKLVHRHADPLSVEPERK